MRTFIYCLVAYLLGSIPFGLITGRMVKGIDIREHGSRNIGATNVFRVVGKKWGIAVFALDALKGYFAVSLPRISAAVPPDTAFLILLAVTAILGHTFSCWIKFKGGKGVATSLGVFLAVCPVPALLTFGLWAAVFGLTRILSVASLAAALAFPVVLFFLAPRGPGRSLLIFVGILLACFIFYTHRANLQRLRQGQEKPLF